MNDMESLSTLFVLEHSHVSPLPSAIGRKTLPLTFFDIEWLAFPDPAHSLFFYEHPITRTQFTETIVPNLKHSLSITLQHFFPFVGKLTIFPSSTTKPEIRYAEGDYVAVTFAECNLDFKDLIGNHPRACDKFYHLIPLLGHTTKVSDYITIPVFSVQVTLFPNHGISIGLTNHHSLGDASTVFCFLEAWTSVAQSGSDDAFLAKGTLPIYARLVKYPKLDESYLKNAKVETFNEGYKLSRLSGPTDKVRATFILTQTAINGLKKLVSTQLPTLAYVSSFTVACAYIWHCVAKLHINDELALFVLAVDCRSRMVPKIPASYFGNCVLPCMTFARTADIKDNEGFITAAKLIGENLHSMLTDKDGVVNDAQPIKDLFHEGRPAMILGVAGSPKIKFCDLDFGFGKARKHEMVSIDYSGSISMFSCPGSNRDLEIGVCLSATEMDVFIRNFNAGLEFI